MKMIRTTKLSDLPPLSAYLHDSTFKYDEITLSDGRLLIGIDRPGYEYGRKRRVLGVIPVRTYPWVPATIEVSHVRELDWNWQRNREAVEGVRTNLLQIEGTPEALIFHADYFAVTALLESFEYLEVFDRGDPARRGGISDLFVRTYNLGAAIDRLRVDA
ncbi:MAG: hypothetical protein LC723_07165 [Actinobacteria bacterium]|nr:hypothetical protein [Actinomycetota bacterium]